MQAQSFYSRVFDAAKSLGATDVQAHLAASQASLETGYGKNLVGNNYFGIKAGVNYAGPSVTAGTQEEVNGSLTGTKANFRSYSDFTDSVRDYMGMMAQNFPDAWNADNLSDAIKGLDTGVFGKYATLGAYKGRVASIANKYGEEAQANSVSSDPLQAAISQPYEANGLLNGVTSLMSQYAAPQATSTVSMPSVPADAAFTPSGLLAGTPQTFAGLAPETTGWSDMAAAGPVSAPMNVTASGLLGQAPDLGANAATAIGVTAKADPHVGAYTPASASVSLPDTASFDMSRFGDVQPSVANFDPARWGAAPVDATATAKAVTNPALDASTNVPMAAALFSPVRPSVTKSFSDLAAAGPISAPVSATPAGLLGSQPNLSATAQVPGGLLSSYAEQPSVPAGIQAINSIAPVSSSLLSGQPIANMESTLSAPTNTGLLSQPSLPGSFVASNVAPDDSQSLGDIPGMAPTVTAPSINVATDPAVSMPALPSLQTVSVPDQPSIAGPADNAVAPAAQTQQTQQVQAAAPTGITGTTGYGKQGLLSGLGINKGMVTGGLLGGIVGGPIGGLLGGLLGRQISNNGGLSGMFGSQPMSINNIGSGLTNVASVYGGAPAGTQATTNNGGRVTSLGDGRVAYTNSYGVTTVTGPNNYNAAYHGPSLFGGNGQGAAPGGGGSGGYV